LAATAGAYITFDESAARAPQGPAKMDFHVGATHTMSMTSTLSTLHGIWEADATITTSDRRLKTSIEPLARTVAAVAKARWSETHPDAAPVSPAMAPSPSQQDPPIGWLLRELRPVSFKLKSGPEAKYLKFGFIAQELETILPNLVRNVGTEKGSEEGTKAIATQDLIALLTLAIQNIQKDVDKQREWMQKEFEAQRRQIDALVHESRMRMDRIERAVFATRV
jgi:hypothetical protein